MTPRPPQSKYASSLPLFAPLLDRPRTLDASNLRACCAGRASKWRRRRNERDRREKRKKTRGRGGGGEPAGGGWYMYTREDGYRVPNRDPRDRVIRIEMNVNPLNTIPGQNTATRGSESGQIR
ncbi:hypothetical protein PUN28_016098 [Cardiocondyla obscurior]|uniref:Uncharacterized protein n=1 Tax=Cardiocondyla obscurior TaxID=286306 RepID=A0AAW2EV86_9HYME